MKVSDSFTLPLYPCYHKRTVSRTVLCTNVLHNENRPNFDKCDAITVQNYARFFQKEFSAKVHECLDQVNFNFLYFPFPIENQGNIINTDSRLNFTPIFMQFCMKSFDRVNLHPRLVHLPYLLCSGHSP